MRKTLKKYTCIVKTGPQKFVKYRLNDLVKFTSFLDRSCSTWTWFNVFDNRTRLQVGNFIKYQKTAAPRI